MKSGTPTLIVTDELFTRKMLKKALNKVGNEVVAVSNGQKAFQMLKENHFRFVIIDLMMPEMDGMELCRKIRKLRSPNYIYIIILITNAENDIVINALDDGVDDYLIKPFSQSELLDCLKNRVSNWRGLQAIKSGFYQEAIEYYEKFVELHPENPGAHYHLGLAQHELDDFEDAIESFKRAIELKPNYSNAYGNLELAQDKLGLYEDPMESYKHAVDLHPDNDKTYYHLGLAQYEHEQYEDAIESFKHAIDLNSNNDDAYHNLGRAQYQLDQYKEAIESYKSSIELDPDTEVYYYNLGLAQYHMDQYADAIESFGHAIALDLDDGDIYHYLGLAHYGLAQYEDAIKNFEHAIALNQKEVYQLSLFTKMIDGYEPIHGLNPKNKNIFYNLGLAQEELGLVKKAIESYETCLRLECFELADNQKFIADVKERIQLLKPKIQIIKRKTQDKELSILLGDIPHGILEHIIIPLVEEVTTDNTRLKVTTCESDSKLLEVGKEHAFDIFFPMLNNILLSPGIFPHKKGLEKRVHLITYFRMRYNKPTIALYSHPDDPSYAEKVKQAGADFVFQVPWKLNGLREAIRRCLDPSVRKNELCILLATNDDDMNSLFADLIEEVIEGKYSLKVMTASDSDEVLKLAQDDEFDIFIPVMNNIYGAGRNNVEFIKQFRAKNNKPIIALTGYAYASFEEQYKKAGANYAFHIPFKAYDFRRAVERCLSLPVRKNILVVDDDLGPRESLKMVLKPFYNVYTADDSEKVLRMLEEEETFWDLIITDIMRPGMSAVDMVKEIRRNNADIPIMVVSGGGNKYGMRLLQEGLVSACIPKPFNFDDMIENVSQILGDDLKNEVKRILYVENDDGCRNLVGEILKKEGYSVTMAKDGSEGLDRILGTRAPYDLIITGIFMPSMNGFKMIKEIRQYKVNTPTMVVSGGGYNIGLMLLKEGLISACFPKPFNCSDFVNTVNRFVRKDLWFFILIFNPFSYFFSTISIPSLI